MISGKQARGHGDGEAWRVRGKQRSGCSAKRTGDGGGGAIPRLDRDDYALWAVNMEVALEAREIWEAIDPGGRMYEKGAEKYRKDRQALTALYSVVPKDVM